MACRCSADDAQSYGDGMRVGESHRVAIHRRNGVRWLVERGKRIGREDAVMRACEGDAVASERRDSSANSVHGVFDGNHRTHLGAAKLPLLPPDFESSRTDSITAPRSIALVMS